MMFYWIKEALKKQTNKQQKGEFVLIVAFHYKCNSKYMYNQNHNHNIYIYIYIYI